MTKDINSCNSIKPLLLLAAAAAAANLEYLSMICLADNSPDFKSYFKHNSYSLLVGVRFKFLKSV